MSGTFYLCHECGNRLEPLRGLTMLWCRKCVRRRRKPTHPALVVTR